MAWYVPDGDTSSMDGVGRRLRARARELGLSDAEVARKAGLTATRYGHYVTDTREPDLATMVRICQVLAMRPDDLLGFCADDMGAVAADRHRLVEFADVMDGSTLELAVAVMQALAATAGLRQPSSGVTSEKASGSHKQPMKPSAKDEAPGC